MRLSFLTLLPFTWVALGCSSSDDSSRETVGSSVFDSSSGGTSASGTVLPGRDTGILATGGSTPEDTSLGGTSTGGTSLGGTSTGGTSLGGTSTSASLGGTSTGGASTGGASTAGATDVDTLRVLQLNVWHDAQTVSNGLELVADIIEGSDADVVTFSEVWNSSGVDFHESLRSTLSERGHSFYGDHAGGDVGLVSRFPIVEQSIVFDRTAADAGSATRSRIEGPGGQLVTMYAAHLDWQHYGLYLPRGYNGGDPDWNVIDSDRNGVPDYVTDVDYIVEYSDRSQRDEAVEAIIADAQRQRDAGDLVLLAGDFNDGSHLDWTEGTKDLFDHSGTVIPWTNSVALADQGWSDSYRELHPDPSSQPGFTWPSTARGYSSTTWTPLSDERDRIDYIYYLPAGLQAIESYVVGSREYSVWDGVTSLESDDRFLLEGQTWPSDHKGVLTVFVVE